MASVLQNFLIGVGLDTKDYDKGAKNITRSLSGMRSLVGVTGAAVAGAFASLGGAAISAGGRIDRLNTEIEKFNTSPQFIYDYRNAIRALGGSAEDAVSAVNAAESALSEFRTTTQIPGLDKLVTAGIQVDPLFRESATGEDFLRELARQIPSLSKEQQLQVQQTIGLPDAVMRSLRQGIDAFDLSVKRASALSTDFLEATQAAREYNQAMAEVNTRFEGIGNTLAKNILPQFTDLLKSFGGFLDNNRDTIARLSEYAAENAVATSTIGAGAAAAASGAGLRLIGLRPLGMFVSRFGQFGMAAGAGMLALDAAKDWDWGQWWKQSKESASDTVKTLTGENDLSKLPDAPLGSEVPQINVQPAQPDVTVTPRPVDAPIILDEPETAQQSVPILIPEDRTQQSSGIIQSDSHDIQYDRARTYNNIQNQSTIINNEEAAQLSPDVIILNSERRTREREQMRMPSIDNNIDLTIELDGRPLETKIKNVIERREFDMIEENRSTVDR